MRLLVVGHTMIDELQIEGRTMVCPGGATCYAGMTAKRLGAEVELVTKVGPDFLDEYVMSLARGELSLGLAPYSARNPTTRFPIVQEAGVRRLYLRARCEDISFDQLVKGDGALVSPVAGEVSDNTLLRTVGSYSHVLVDVQGFVRRFAEDGSVVLRKSFPKVLLRARLLKMDEEEASMLGVGPLEAVKILRKRGPELVILTRSEWGAVVSFGEKMMELPALQRGHGDPTGAGDMFAGAFLFSYVKSGDPLWSACIGTAASSLSIGPVGLSKIPVASEVSESADMIMERARQLT